MALVAYSDSEGSGDESVPAPAPQSTKPSAKIADKSAFQKITNAAEPRKIKVDLPSVKAEPGQQDEQQPPAKRARTAGAFGGFNSLLPAPKRPVSNAPKTGVSLKTSSEAVFSRAQPAQSSDWNGDDDERNDDVNGTTGASVDVDDPPKDEPKLVGKATKFKPLSVSNKKKPAKKSQPSIDSKDAVAGQLQPQQAVPSVGEPLTEPAVPPPKPKRSLFSVPQVEANIDSRSQSGSYEPLIADRDLDTSKETPQSQDPGPVSETTAANTNALQSLASDLNLTPAQRRHLFGRGGKSQDVNITHFNLDSEYAANEQLRQAGEVVEHRAVKAIAPGKHSLQQLVNNARSQQEGLEDKWAAGRQARGEGGSKYGWGR